MSRRNLLLFIPAMLLAGAKLFAGEPKRRAAIPIEVIKRFNMQPSTGGFTVLGEDGRTFDLDETFHVIFELEKSHWAGK